MSIRRFVGVVGLCLMFSIVASRADDAPTTKPEPTADTAKGAVKLFCHRLLAGEADKALELCPADTSDEDKALVKAAIECYAAYEELRKNTITKFEANEAIPDNFTLYGPKPPTDSYVDSAKETADADDANRVELKMSTYYPPIVAVRQGDAWRVVPRELFRSSSPNRDDPGDYFKTFIDHAKQLAQDLADGKFQSAREVQNENNRRRSDYMRQQSERRRKGGL